MNLVVANMRLFEQKCLDDVEPSSMVKHIAGMFEMIAQCMRMAVKTSMGLLELMLQYWGPLNKILS